MTRRRTLAKTHGDPKNFLLHDGGDNLQGAVHSINFMGDYNLKFVID